MILFEYLFLLIPMLIAGLVFWGISLIKKDVSVVDILWSLFFIIVALTMYLQLESPTLRAGLVLLLVSIWGLRLALYILVRHWGHEEDHRYKTIRENNNPGFEYKSLYLIFSFQAVVAWIVALPLFFAIKADLPLGLLDLLGLTLWLTGMYFESVSDYQLYRFKKDPNNKGKILTDGLWKYTRHPNYFGESLIWWGYFCFAMSVSAYVAIISPLLITFLLLKFSGVSLLEKTMKSRPGYEDYIKSTNAFIPGFPRKGKVL